jgi:hypothetical protein
MIDNATSHTDRYAFEVRIVHPSSGRRLPANDLIRSYRIEKD